MVRALFISHCCILIDRLELMTQDESKLSQMRLSFSSFTRIFQYDDLQVRSSKGSVAWKTVSWKSGGNGGRLGLSPFANQPKTLSALAVNHSILNDSFNRHGFIPSICCDLG
jgi:hypothetical protein